MSDNDLHLPHGSIWPFLLATAISALGVGAIMAKSVSYGPAVLVLGFVFFVIALAGWIMEDTKWWDQKVGTGEGVGKLGTLLFMSSEIFLFGALFATYFTLRAKDLAEGNGWPDQHVHFEMGKVIAFTVILISSSGTAQYAEKQLMKDNRKGFLTWWGITIVLGGIFIAGQVMEYMTLIGEGFTMSSSHFASTFYMITGFHGLHVFGGLVFMMIVFIRAIKGQFNSERHLAPAMAGLYWHFVDAIWIFVFFVLYIIQ